MWAAAPSVPSPPIAAKAEKVSEAVKGAAEASKEIPFGRYGEPIELGRFAAFLLSPAASYVSGLAAQVDSVLHTA